MVDLHLLTRQVTPRLTEEGSRRILSTDAIGVPEEGIDRLYGVATTLRLATLIRVLTHDTMARAVLLPIHFEAGSIEGLGIQTLSIIPILKCF